jgi:hypothetical protein
LCSRRLTLMEKIPKLRFAPHGVDAHYPDEACSRPQRPLALAIPDEQQWFDDR